MLEIVFKLLAYAPQVAMYVLLALLLSIIVWRFSRFYFKTNATNNKILGVETSLNQLVLSFKTLNQVLLEKEIITRSCYSEANSPRVINDLGKKLLDTSGAGTIYENMKDELLIDLEKKTIGSLLELERESLNVLLEKMNDDRFNSLENFAFENPNFDGNKLSYTDLLFVMALKLRDYYRKKHPKPDLKDE